MEPDYVHPPFPYCTGLSSRPARRIFPLLMVMARSPLPDNQVVFRAQQNTSVRPHRVILSLAREYLASECLVIVLVRYIP